MKFAFVSIMSSASWAACEELWSAAARQALLDGHQVLVSVYDHTAHTPQIAGLVKLGAQLEARPARKLVRDSSLLSFFLGAYRAVGTFEPDAICVSQGGTYDVGRTGNLSVLRRLLQKTRIPYVVLCHCEQPRPQRLRWRRAREVLRGARILGMLSVNLRQLSERHLDTSLENVRVFQNPLKFQRDQPLPWPSLPALKLAFVGRLEGVKGLDVLIEVLAADSWRAREWSLTVCGEGPDRTQLEQLTRERGLADRIQFAGFVTDITTVWAAHHILVMPSRMEGIPIALTEAMLCGRPAVATPVGGIPDTINNGITGYLAASSNADDFALALERMWTDREALAIRGDAAFAAASQSRDAHPAGTLVRWLTECGNRDQIA
ncbi:MAG TPA: glycosyltransferase family 4 protein [Steroidobacteraceae bacterium]|nr:glycosyltransferase family 4 protein [Steroidobacteraceae bacterium]